MRVGCSTGRSAARAPASRRDAKPASWRPKISARPFRSAQNLAESISAGAHWWGGMAGSSPDRCTPRSALNLRSQPTPPARGAGSPERSRLGGLRPLARPGHGQAPEEVHAPAIPRA
jgi:hypothetical protein